MCVQASVCVSACVIEDTVNAFVFTFIYGIWITERVHVPVQDYANVSVCMSVSHVYRRSMVVNLNWHFAPQETEIIKNELPQAQYKLAVSTQDAIWTCNIQNLWGVNAFLITKKKKITLAHTSWCKKCSAPRCRLSFIHRAAELKLHLCCVSVPLAAQLYVTLTAIFPHHTASGPY